MSNCCSIKYCYHMPTTGHLMFVYTLSISSKYCDMNKTIPGRCLNITILSYQYRDPHVKYKMFMRPFYLKHGNPQAWKDGLYIETGPCCVIQLHTSRNVSHIPEKCNPIIPLNIPISSWVVLCFTWSGFLTASKGDTRKLLPAVTLA